MKILITGVAGFIGSNLAVRLLADGHEVVGLDNLAYGVREQVPEGVPLHVIDVRSREVAQAFEGVNVVFHLAAKNCISDCQSNPIETADINVTGTVNVFEACREAGVRKVIYAESSSIYEGSRVLPTPEEEEHPESFYACSKMATKFFADAYARYHGIRSTALRYFCVYGPRQDYRRTIPPVFSAFIIKLLRGEAPIIYGTGEKRRDFIHVDDINDFHVRCLTDERTDGQVFNLGEGRNYSVNEVYETIADLLDVRIPPVRKPDLPGEAQETLADITRARSLGWKPRIGLRDGLLTMIRFIQSEKAAGRV
ncbi:MAG: NAD-dependent epimerase/dehydratase family protein [Terrimicrobiaceae bacterium]|nr:NAD-dependent epimerase/dehydratase family protein [Terrimicrobiaceae bacterium]